MPPPRLGIQLIFFEKYTHLYYKYAVDCYAFAMPRANLLFETISLCTFVTTHFLLMAYLVRHSFYLQLSWNMRYPYYSSSNSDYFDGYFDTEQELNAYWKTVVSSIPCRHPASGSRWTTTRTLTRHDWSRASGFQSSPAEGTNQFQKFNDNPLTFTCLPPTFPPPGECMAFASEPHREPIVL